MPTHIDIHAKARTVGPATIHHTADEKDHSKMADMSPRDAFVAAYPEIQSALMAAMKRDFGIDSDRGRYLVQMMDETCQGGKYNRGITVVEIAIDLMKKDGGAVSGETVFLASVLGWCIEFMQAHFLVEDDIMDDSQTRRGKPCWYKMPGVSQAVAINDGLILFAWCTKMLEMFIPKTHPNKAFVISALHDVHMKTCIGQFFDTTSMYDADTLDAEKPQESTKTYREYTVSVYNRIVKYKTAFYTYHLPMLFGLAITNQLDTVNHEQVEELSVVMGEYFQVQDDFLDCYGDPKVIGKIGTDIQDKKCCWLAAKFLEKGDDEAKATDEVKADIATWKANYGEHDEAKVAKIKELYKKHNITGTFEQYEIDVVKRINELFAEIAKDSKAFSDSLRPLWDRTYKRKK